VSDELGLRREVIIALFYRLDRDYDGVENIAA
jgi:hypothetical protein